MGLSPGDTVAGFRVLDSLGKGGMGEVYLVENPQLGRNEALKIISLAGAGNDEFLRRFTNEARTAAALDHPNIITVHQYGIDDGKPWFTMSHVDGPDLTDTTLRPGDVATIVSQVAAALDYAHGRGVIHRDIKPANIMITRSPDGAVHRVIVLDFGIARPATGPRLTATDAFVGTVAYTAPEVIGGGAAVAHSDQYSLATTAYRLLTGVIPFGDRSAVAMMKATLSEAPPALSSRRPDLAALDPVFARAMAKDPGARYPDCRAFADALTQALIPAPPSRAGLAPPSRPPHSGPAPHRPPHIAGPAQKTPTQKGPAQKGPAQKGPAQSAPAQNGRTPNGLTPNGPPRSGPSYAGPVSPGSPAYRPAPSGPRRSPGSPPPGPVHRPLPPVPSGPARPPSGPAQQATMIGGPSDAAIMPPGGGYPAVSGMTDGPGDAARAASHPTPGVPDPLPAAPLDSRGPRKRRKWLVVALATVAVLALAGVGGWFGYQHFTGERSQSPEPVVEAVDHSPELGMAALHGCAVDDAQLYCWGTNTSGQLGVANVTGRSVPQRVGLDDVTAVTVGSYFTTTGGDTAESNTCAVAGGEAYCWGADTFGQLGDGEPSTANRRTPGDPVPDLSDVTAIANGMATTCAVAGGKLYCWGANFYGQLGQGTPTDTNGHDTATPQHVTALQDVTAVSVASGTVCAIAGGELSCWGRNNNGQLGNDSRASSSAPVAVDGLADVTAVDVGDTEEGASTCAIAGGEAYCWGHGIGSATTTSSKTTPQRVTGLPEGADLQAIGVSYSAACVVADGDVYCWGNNATGQLGTGGTSDVRAPTKVSSLSGVIDITLFNGTTCAKTGDTVKCWGYNGDPGRLGSSTQRAEYITAPAEVALRRG